MKSRLVYFALLLAFCMDFCFEMTKVRDCVQIEGIVNITGEVVFKVESFQQMVH